jgi:hypothetical protein
MPIPAEDNIVVFHADRAEPRRPTSFQQQSTSSPHPHSKRVRIGQVARKAPILERHIRVAEIGVRQRRTRSSRKALPSNKRLLATARARETKSAKTEKRTC